MRILVLIGALILSMLLAIANNVLSPNKVPWHGSPQIYDKPEGY